MSKSKRPGKPTKKDIAKLSLGWVALAANIVVAITKLIELLPPLC